MARRSHWAAAALGMGGLVLFLTGCGSEESGASDDAPPDHIVKATKSQGKWRYGVEDTLVVEFTEPIDTAELEVEFSDTSGKAWRFDGREKLLVYGTKDDLGSHFPVNAPFTLTLRKLRDDAGNTVEGAIEEEFMPWRWVDQDMLDGTFLGYDSLLLNDSTWVDGTSIRDTFVFEAKLDGLVNIGLEDRTDLKVLRLRPPDTLDVTVRMKRGLKVELQTGGPFPIEGLEDALRKHKFAAGVQSGSRGEVDTTFRAEFDAHDLVFNNASAIGAYALRLGLVENNTEGFYRVTLKVRKRRI